MAILPDSSTTSIGEVITEGSVQPNATYKMDIDNDAVRGSVDTNLEAVRQAAYKCLNTERYKHIIYSWDYGAELTDLIGKPVPYCLSEIPRRIKDALIQDDRIDDVTDFDVKYTGGGEVLAEFTIETIYGNLSMRMEVKI